MHYLTLEYIKCTSSVLVCTTNTGVLLQIYRGTNECARLTVNLHASCTVYIYMYLLYKAEKPSVRPHFLVERIFAVDARIHVKLARNEAPVFWEHEVCFYNILTPAVRHLRRFECQGVDDSCRNFTYIPANRSPDTIDNIYYICFQ